MKKCPHCAEEIQEKAKVCKHCGRDLKTGLTGQEQPKWHRGIAAVLSLVIPGAGQMYKGQILRGIVWLGIVAIGYAVILVPGMLLHLLCIIGASMGDPYKQK